MLDALKANGKREPKVKLVVVAARTADAYAAAVKVAEKRRADGVTVEMDITERSDKERAAYAKQRGASEIVVVDARGRTEQRTI